MPELPEVETVRRGLEPFLAGRRIKKLLLRRADLRAPFPPRLKERVEGAVIQRLTRRAKYILLFLGNGEVMAIHLGMSGRISAGPAGSARAPGKHDHVVMDLDDGGQMVFADPRRFGTVLLLPEGNWQADKAFAGLGPEPLEAAFDGRLLAVRLKGKKTSIKAALLDQRVVAGLGNIYVCEALFHAGISPERPAGQVGAKEAARLCAAIKKVLNDAIGAGGSTLRDYRHANGDMGYFQHRFSVYDREGQACPGCNCKPERTGGVSRIVQGGRSSFYCPRKQA